MKKHIEEEKTSFEKTVDPKWKKSLERNYLRYITRGLIISLPIIIILFIISFLFGLILNILTPISNVLDPLSEEPHWSIHILSLIVLVGFFYLVGKLIASTSGRRYISNFENEYLMQIPLYSTIRDLVHQFAGVQKMPFSRVVLVDPFDSGVLMTGFITEEIVGDIYTVFVPTAPNPTNGNIYHVPASRLHFVNATSEIAMRTVVGMGTGSSLLFEDVNLKIDRTKPTSPTLIEPEKRDQVVAE